MMVAPETDNALTEASFREALQDLSDAAMKDWMRPGAFLALERVRLFGIDRIRDVAYPRYPWKHHGSFAQDGLRFDIWLHWDGRARIEHDGEVILRMWAPAAEIFLAIDERSKAGG